MKTLWLKPDAIDWRCGVLYIKTPHGSHTVVCKKAEVPNHVKLIIEGIAHEHGYRQIAMDMSGD